MSERRWTLPNIITVGRIAACPAVFLLVMAPGSALRILGFVLFLAAALSDLWDGYLARKHGWVTDMGKLLDPLADKLLLVATVVPIYLISQRPGPVGDVPWIGPLPLWIVAILFGRELLVTLLRQVAKRKGVVIAAGTSGKRKALVQNLFAGGVLLWLPVEQMAVDRGWDTATWAVWSSFHRLWVVVTLALAVFLTLYSLLDYFWKYRGILGVRV
ncbi:MAG: CDP-diacylglycerol--glycerol-3-phosphate 3-phosphatidyltransferase [Gemmatimonadetes bacterium]|nr:CDP-diacylglycerol--glycerol-3-phosphate 3-phosphatidyltransferase [Gemmatimonadota bacterium]MBT8404719.1 CDP-diacylglycerol--glycerol-3-phosphate 3-phosphatidyltransferase [Gemmatimonadota bacterium]NNK62798.1 CDP-diacylglycerol--glycerol-3-phosphate 3-phosphatidyltransferase [Gemmatimonadota bacterium]